MDRTTKNITITIAFLSLLAVVACSKKDDNPVAEEFDTEKHPIMVRHVLRHDHWHRTKASC